MSDDVLMLSLITLMTAFALGLLSLKFGVDSRRDERNL